MIASILMLLVLVVSFLLFGALVRFSENIIRPLSAPSADQLSGSTDREETGPQP
jgi:hypothetical protein